MVDWKAFLLSWSFEPVVVVGLLVAAGLYARGWRRLRRRGRGGLVLERWRAWCFGGGLLTLGIALLSPIATYDGLLFHMHMIQHVLMIMVAAPLVWLGAPLIPTLWAFGRRTRRTVGRWLHASHPVHRVGHFLTSAGIALPLFIVSLAVWHYPPLYDAAQGRTFVHELEHAVFFGTALLFWWPVIHPSGGHRRLSYGAGILYLFPAKLAGFGLGAFLTLSNTPFYQTYIQAPRIWGMSVLSDQQIGGLIMWVIGGLLYIIPLLLLVMLMMRQDEGDLWVPETVRARDVDPALPEGTRPRPAAAGASSPDASPAARA